ncbi:TIGR03086 family metal-binding protein [Nocardia huaxiensis]|uniref:TIGR03086 family protein n=1 Tax=Nocardia huaxiensis TaxID=2755382 RepID=A0A7D6VGQ0_9NOCA|nr:TIGR03086 family metal-binding protein [Nocardia huaxiensis]QLY32315.1 TIGR03086 family protein [Nocardia huaxiensis]UFS93980.1 TIGR03086 family metal-binding protein [Nocardia huaxiensis]
MNTPQFDLEPAATDMEAVVAGIGDSQMDAPTPCAGTSVHILLAHVVGLTEAFRQAATKEMLGRSQTPASARPELPHDWRNRIPAQLKALVAAWREPSAWTGDTEAGGVQLPATQMAEIALNELVVHAWDLARATGQPYLPDSDDLNILLDMLRDTPAEGTPGLFGPVIPIPDNASTLDRVLGLTGRDPAWTAHKATA